MDVKAIPMTSWALALDGLFIIFVLLYEMINPPMVQALKKVEANVSARVCSPAI